LYNRSQHRRLVPSADLLLDHRRPGYVWLNGLSVDLEVMFLAVFIRKAFEYFCEILERLKILTPRALQVLDLLVSLFVRLHDLNLSPDVSQAVLFLESVLCLHGEDLHWGIQAFEGRL
jgi:hypothetical protein